MLAAPLGDHRLRRSGVRQSLFPWLAPCTLCLPIGLEPPQQKGAAGGVERLGTIGLRNLLRTREMFLSLVTACCVFNIPRRSETPEGRTVACPGAIVQYAAQNMVLDRVSSVWMVQRLYLVGTLYLLEICRALYYHQAHSKEAVLRCMLLDGIPLPLPARAAPQRLLPHR